MTATMTTTAPRVKREVLEDRWVAATLAPWRPGGSSRLGQRLHAVLSDLVERVAMVDFSAEENRGTPAGNAYPELVEELEATIRRTLVERLAEADLARHGWEGITGERAPWETVR